MNLLFFKIFDGGDDSRACRFNNENMKNPCLRGGRFSTHGKDEEAGFCRFVVQKDRIFPCPHGERRELLTHDWKNSGCREHRGMRLSLKACAPSFNQFAALERMRGMANGQNFCTPRRRPVREEHFWSRPFLRSASLRREKLRTDVFSEPSQIARARRRSKEAWLPNNGAR